MRTGHGRRLIFAAALAAATGVFVPALAAPSLFDAGLGELKLVASGSALSRVDGLAFDPAGNLFAALEVVGSGGGIVYVDKASGNVSGLLAPISGADQVKYHSPGSFYVTSELNAPPGGPGGIYRVEVTYGSGVPLSASATYLATSPALIDNPEGLVVLGSSGSFGNAGDLIVAEDRTGGRVIKVALGSATAVTSVLVGNGAALGRPEGLAFGDFGGQAAPALYLAETLANRVLRIDAAGNFAEFGNSAAVVLAMPDNLAFGPDGFLYVAEDPTGGASGRIMRLDAGGNYTTLAQGFDKPAGLAFDPLTGHLYIAEQQANKIWRVEFAAAVPEPAHYAMLLAGLALLGFAVRWRNAGIARAALAV